MKFRFTFLIFFISFCANAKYINATVYYNNGQSETGLINSFLENDFFDFNFFGTFEEGLVYHDKSIKFKFNEKEETKRIAIDDIDKIIIHYEGFDKEYRALFIRNINRKGVIEDSNVKIFLPLLRKGKVNLYGFYYKDVQTNHESRMPSSRITISEIFYFQNANENYAFNFYDIELQDIFNLRGRIANPLKELFKDCPELTAKVHSMVYEGENLSKEEKKRLKEQNKNLFKALQKEYRKKPKKEKRGDLLLFHQYYMKTFDDLLIEYENCK